MADEKEVIELNAIPWYRWPPIQHLVLAALIEALGLLHVANKISDTDLAMLVNQALEVGGMLWASYSAKKALAPKPQPALAVSQAHADQLNSTNDKGEHDG